MIFSRSAVVLKRGGEERRNGGENGEREIRWRRNGDGKGKKGRGKSLLTVAQVAMSRSLAI